MNDYQKIFDEEYNKFWDENPELDEILGNAEAAKHGFTAVHAVGGWDAVRGLKDFVAFCTLIKTVSEL